MCMCRSFTVTQELCSHNLLDMQYAISPSHSLRILCRGRATLRHNNSERAGFYAVTRF